MKIKVNNQNYIILDQQKGGRILELKLSNHIVIKDNHNNYQTSSGNYLLYPWVNRVVKNPIKASNEFTDKSGYPLHGLYVNCSRQICVSGKDNEMVIEMTPNQTFQGTYSFKETYTLKEGSLTLLFEIFDDGKINLPYCFGYHPFLQIDEEKIEGLKISTNIKTQVNLASDLLVIHPFEEKEIEITSKDKYDTLFNDGSYLQLENSEGVCMKIESDLKYWQIYTPADGKRIAVQPMSFCGNLYQIYDKDPFPLTPKGQITFSCWNQK